MLPLIPFFFLAYLFLLACAATVFPQPATVHRPGREWFQPEQTTLGPQLTLDAWLDHEEKIALRNLLSNISPGGLNAPDAVPGTVIASPSKHHPDYYYQCRWLAAASSNRY